MSGTASDRLAVRSKPSASARPTMLLLVLVCLALGCWGAPAPEPVEHVVVIGVDGLSPDGIRGAETPNIDALVAAGRTGRP